MVLNFIHLSIRPFIWLPLYADGVSVNMAAMGRVCDGSLGLWYHEVLYMSASAVCALLIELNQR